VRYSHRLAGVLTTKLTIRLSLVEMEELRGLALRARLSVSELIRQWIRVGELPVKEREVQRPRDWREKP
jgi:ribbon-helix-helix CopG family protein